MTTQEDTSDAKLEGMSDRDRPWIGLPLLVVVARSFLFLAAATLTALSSSDNSPAPHLNLKSHHATSPPPPLPPSAPSPPPLHHGLPDAAAGNATAIEWHPQEGLGLRDAVAQANGGGPDDARARSSPSPNSGLDFAEPLCSAVYESFDAQRTTAAIPGF
ncbi:hypothetical protein BDV95DRAFT_664340 [Massariosphaeria phaeospora]|uniref:Uncharacterized protein n=1 Tax=Massariosphaeria phaeospora TaxID=100035 RepID=A0A7C8IM66_9PLEO|nr:hypothetical protein BDV95DRAFT_664340 [Massariosphaeria phaeospora]